MAIKYKNKIIVKEVEYCLDPISKMLGLMFTMRKHRALVFVYHKEKIIHLHMFFVFYPIDVLWLNKNKKVVKIKEYFGPFELCVADKKAQYIVELPEGIIKKYKIKLGDKLEF